jgi:putative endonuclease
MKTMYVYILECSDKSYYTGVTNNLEKRFEEHQQGISRNCFTFLRRPLKIVYHVMFNNPTDAIEFEKQIKGWNRKKKEALILHNYELLPELSINSKKASAHSSTGSE